MDEDKLLVGWREWVGLPDLGLNRVKAKVDTGARTSALHAFDLKVFTEKGVQMVWFAIHPFQRRSDVIKECRTEVLDYRWVSDSGGHREKRYVIQSNLALGERSWPIEITLTNRENMKFRMLLGRTAMRRKLIVDPDASYLQGKRKHGKIKGDN